MPKKGLPAEMCISIAGRKPEAASLERQWPKWPTPGRMSFWKRMLSQIWVAGGGAYWDVADQ
jgi:hypothetical protein